MILKRLIAAALLGLTPQAPAADPVSLLPENTLVCVSVTKPERLAALAEHPVTQAVKMGRLKELFGKALDALGEGGAAKVWKEECGMAPGEVLAKFSGAMAFGLYDLKDRSDVEEGEQEAEMSLVAAFDGDEKLVSGIWQALAKIEAGEGEAGEEAGNLAKLLQSKERTEEVDGVTIHILKPGGGDYLPLDAIAWCVRNKTLLVATGEKQLRGMLERAVSDKAEGTFAASETWKSAREGTGDADLILAVNLAQIMRLVTGTPDGGTFLAMITALELNRIQSIAFGLRHDERAIEFKVHVPCESLPWMFDYLKRAPGAEVPKFFPKDLDSASWTPVDFGALAQGILEKAPEVFPPMEAQTKAGLAGLKAASGVDIEKEILQQLGTGYFQVTRTLEKYTMEEFTDEQDPGNLINIMVPTKQGAVLGVKLKDAKVVDAALRNLAEKVLKEKIDLDAREYMGWKIHAMKNSPPPAAEEEEGCEPDEAAPEVKPIPVSLVIADDWLLVAVGRQEVLESVLGGMKNPPADHFWARPDIQKAMGTLPDGETYAGFQDLTHDGPAALAGMAGLLALVPGADFLEEFSDMEEILKTVETPLHIFEKYHLDRDAISATSRIVPAPAAE